MKTHEKKKYRELDFRQCFLYILDHIIVVVIFVIAFVSLILLYNYTKSNKKDDYKNKLTEIITNNKSAYYPVPGQTVFNTEKKELNGTCIVRAKIFIDFNFSSVEGNANLDYSSMINKFQYDAAALFLSDNALEKVCNLVNSKNYKNVDDPISTDELRWLINTNFFGANIFNYSVTDIDKERANDIANELSNIFIKYESSYEAFDSVKLHEGPFLYFDDIGNNNNISIKSMAKYIIVGAVLGLVFACGILVLVFVFKDCIFTSSDLLYLDIDMYGSIPARNKYRDAEYKRIAYNLIAKNESKKIFLIPADEKTKIDAIADNVSATLKDNNNNSEFIKSECVKQAPEAVLNAQKTDGIVLVATYGRTKMKDVDYSKNELLKSGKAILGAIIVNSKHN